MLTLSPKGQALVRAGKQAAQPTAADRERLLSQLRARLGDAALPADLGTATVGTVATGSTLPLISALVVGVGILGGTLFYAGPHRAGHDRPQPTVTAPVASPPTMSEPVAPPADEPTAAVAMPPAVAPAALTTSGGRGKDRLAAEVAILSRATRDLRAGRPAGALKALDEYRRKFPKGLLKDEYGAASAQALCALERFGQAYAILGELPPSPLVVRAKQFCDGKLAGR
jgi:hypothetical protein